MIRFKAKDIKTGEWVYGDLAYVWYKKSIIPMIVTHGGNRGMIYVVSRHRVYANTIEQC